MSAPTEEKKTTAIQQEVIRVKRALADQAREEVANIKELIEHLKQVNTYLSNLEEAKKGTAYEVSHRIFSIQTMLIGSPDQPSAGILGLNLSFKSRREKIYRLEPNLVHHPIHKEWILVLEEYEAMVEIAKYGLMNLREACGMPFRNSYAGTYYYEQHSELEKIDYVKLLSFITTKLATAVKEGKIDVDQIRRRGSSFIAPVQPQQQEPIPSDAKSSQGAQESPSSVEPKASTETSNQTLSPQSPQQSGQQGTTPGS